MKQTECNVKWKWVVLWSLWAMRIVRQPTEIVIISSGALRGSVSPDGTHHNYLGIPYATVEERFQVAREDPKWNRVFEAIDEHIYCHQKMGNIVTGHENCLVINVYTPVSAKKSLPVMVYFHEGGFLFGSGSRFLHGPEYLVTKEIVLVTFNYRLSILGFLCLGTKEVPGNIGLKDQVAALKWVQRNIKAFGGDPDNVTIFGESAGAASVSFHMLAPMSKGLFRKAIIQSGTAVTPWGIQPDPILTASRLAEALGYKTKNPHELYSIFSNKSIDELYAVNIPKPIGGTYISQVIFIPCVEKVIEGENPFITDLPYNMFESGNYAKVPTLIGHNSEEGYYFASQENATELQNINFDVAIPIDLAFPNESDRKTVALKIKKFYIGDGKVADNIIGYSRYFGDLFLTYPVVEQTDLILKTSNERIYSYFFNYSGWRNFVKFQSGFRWLFEPGATHADDLMYIFKPCMAPSLFENRMIDIITTYWTNFAKYGEPNPEEWLPADRKHPRSLILGTSQTQPLWYSPSLLFWREMYQKYRMQLSDLKS